MSCDSTVEDYQLTSTCYVRQARFSLFWIWLIGDRVVTSPNWAALRNRLLCLQIGVSGIKKGKGEKEFWIV